MNTDDGKDGWYARIENNGWRLVSDRLIYASMVRNVIVAKVLRTVLILSAIFSCNGSTNNEHLIALMFQKSF